MRRGYGRALLLVPRVELVRLGLPPRARGTPHPWCDRARAGRNTPACAGNTNRYSGPSRLGREHPRLRGEHVIDREYVFLDDGTPPPARGTLPAVTWESPPGGTPPPARGTRYPLRRCIRSSRNTPACAGNTGTGGLGCSTSPEHPRLRGEHLVEAARYISTRGTPPPARGTQRPVPHRTETRRNTPACAGNTAQCR